MAAHTRNSRSNFVRSITGTQHEDKIDGSNPSGDVVDVFNAVLFSGLEVETHELDEIRSGGQAPERPGYTECIELPGRNDSFEN